ncbi:MAG: hypothetical protein WEF50_07540 [Myxococcota bacterium]
MAAGSNPLDSGSTPSGPQVPLLSPLSSVLLVGLLLATLAWRSRAARSTRF